MIIFFCTGSRKHNILKKRRRKKKREEGRKGKREEGRLKRDSRVLEIIMALIFLHFFSLERKSVYLKKLHFFLKCGTLEIS